MGDKPTDSLFDKFEITALSPMQEKAGKTIRSKSDMVLLSPTGTGKTLAFLLPLIETLDENYAEIQILILVHSLRAHVVRAFTPLIEVCNFDLFNLSS